MTFGKNRFELPSAATALPGRAHPIPTAETHFVNGRPLKGPYPQRLETAVFAMGSFWGAERIFWTLPGVHVTAAGYANGLTPNPTYVEVCSGRTGHAEAVRVVYDPRVVSFTALLRLFWEGHDPTQGMRQGRRVGAQYRSGIYTSDDAQTQAAEAMRAAYQQALAEQGFGRITTEIEPAGAFYFAEADHQQHLAKNPAGDCGAGGLGVSCPLGARLE